MTIHSELNRLITLSKAWNIDEAVWVLWAYCCDRDEICWAGFWTTPYNIRTIKGNCYASQVRVKFLGGPYGNQEYVGSLSMFVIDRVLMSWQKDKVDWTWLLYFNCDTTTHIKDQLGEIRPNFQRQPFLTVFGDERDGHWEPSYSDENVIDHVQIGDDIYPILESGRQGLCVLGQGKQLSAKNDDGIIHRWSSSGRVEVCERT